MVVIDLGAVRQASTLTDTPRGYTSRCIVNDAQRAAKMGDDPKKANSWDPGSWQWCLWVDTFDIARERL